MARTHYSWNAPFRSYTMTDTAAYQNGVECARSWKAHWNHRPGGPFVATFNPHTDLNDPDWIEYCAATARHNILFRQGWEDEMQKLRPNFLASLGGYKTFQLRDAA